MVAKATETRVVVSPPKIEVAQFRIVGISPYVQARFTEKAKQELARSMREGQRSKKGKTKEPRDFEAEYQAMMHRDVREGWIGIPAAAFRSAMISACRLCGFRMTIARLSVFVLAEGIDSDGIPLVRIYGEPEPLMLHTRNSTGVVDLRMRPMWREWHCLLRVQYDSDQFSVEDVTNLLLRAGQQVGIGEGRPDSRQSAGMGWGLFTIAE